LEDEAAISQTAQVLVLSEPNLRDLVRLHENGSAGAHHSVVPENKADHPQRQEQPQRGGVEVQTADADPFRTLDVKGEAARPRLDTIHRADVDEDLATAGATIDGRNLPDSPWDRTKAVANADVTSIRPDEQVVRLGAQRRERVLLGHCLLG
jgi:hypothetical protein